ncbi:hypothetical protein V2J09_004215 [Rumex salicifolius]
MGKPIGEVMLDTSHGLCTWHIMDIYIEVLNSGWVECSSRFQSLGKTRFNVRKAYEDKNKNGEVSSKTNNLGKHCRAEMRTGYKAHIGCVLINDTKKYQIHDFVSEHNHPLHLPEMIHLLTSQIRIPEAQAIEIDFADDVGIKPREARQFLGAHVGGQLDCEEQMTNVFWVDAKMLIDYALFGGVVAFDTTFGTNKEHRPLGVLVGFNHFRELVIFGATLLYDETKESFRWLFETFLATHDNKKSKIIFTDQDISMDGSNVLQDFKARKYNCHEVDEYEEAFSALRLKVKKGTWLESIYALKEKWAECYMKDVPSFGMRST